MITEFVNCIRAVLAGLSGKWEMDIKASWQYDMANAFVMGIPSLSKTYFSACGVAESLSKMTHGAILQTANQPPQHLPSPQTSAPSMGIVAGTSRQRTVLAR